MTEPIHPWVAAARHGVRFGVAMIGPASDWSSLFRWADEAEALGFDGWFKADHPNRSVDCWQVLAAVAARTRRIRVGTLVSCVFYRHPAIIARTAADVDRLSNGRLVLGLGIGDDAAEHQQLGLRFPPVPERHAVHAEAIQVIRGLWGPDPLVFLGDHFQIHGLTIPPPIQRPRVPLLIGGGGIQSTLRQVAQYADACNFGPHPWTGSVETIDDVRRRLDALRGHCETVGRPYDAILKTHIVLPLVLAPTRSAVETKARVRTQGMVAGTPDELVAYFRELIAAGMEYFIACIREGDDETFQLYGREVMPRLASG